MSCTKHGMARSPIYRIWTAMHQRCINPKEKNFASYGGRGIRVCERWSKFENFFADMGHRPEGRTLNRVNNDADYSPANCEWSTVREQNRNTTRNRYLTINGTTRCISEWASISGLSKGTIRGRIEKGWPPLEAVTLPPHAERNKVTNRLRWALEHCTSPRVEVEIFAPLPEPCAYTEALFEDREPGPSFDGLHRVLSALPDEQPGFYAIHEFEEKQQ